MVPIIISVALGMQILQFMSTVPEIILKTFKEYPYLHCPTLEEKKEYISWFAHHQEGILVVAHEQDIILGFITGIPMKPVIAYLPEMHDLLKMHKQDLTEYYYCGDVIVLPEYQKKGICSKMFSSFEQKVKTLGYKGICLITSIREENHPLRPKEYQDPEKIWHHYGFEETSIILKNFQPTVIDHLGTVENRENAFVFWVKNFNK